MQQGWCGTVLNPIFIKLDLKYIYYNKSDFFNLYNIL